MELTSGVTRIVCRYWKAGKCTRNPCQFLHGDAPALPNLRKSNPSLNPHRWQRGQQVNGSSATEIRPSPKVQNNLRHQEVNGSSTASEIRPTPKVQNKLCHHEVNGSSADTETRPTPKVQNKLCHHWADGKCWYGDNCRYLHKWSDTDSIAMLKHLPGHEKAIGGISLPTGSDKLFTSSKDESVRVWDCQTRQCVKVVNLGGEVGCLVSGGPWLFIAAPNAVKAWNTQTDAELSLGGPVGKVSAMSVGNGMLFAGTEKGDILAWRFNETTNSFDPAPALKEHKLGVVALVVGGNRLYSGSIDKTIKVWDLGTLKCVQTLTEHTSTVTSVLRWNHFLISCSLDQTIKVWDITETGGLKEVYTHKEDHGLLRLTGIYDSESKPVLVCSCNDNAVRLYDLPTFNQRGKIFSKEEVRAMEVGPDGLLFTGDSAGSVNVWKLSEAT